MIKESHGLSLYIDSSIYVCFTLRRMSKKIKFNITTLPQQAIICICTDLTLLQFTAMIVHSSLFRLEIIDPEQSLLKIPIGFLHFVLFDTWYITFVLTFFPSPFHHTTQPVLEKHRYNSSGTTLFDPTTIIRALLLLLLNTQYGGTYSQIITLARGCYTHTHATDTKNISTRRAKQLKREPKKRTKRESEIGEGGGECISIEIHECIEKGRDLFVFSPPPPSPQYQRVQCLKLKN